MKKSPAVDAYIEKSADFARPILKKVRKLFHRACPDVEETMKWSVPHFEYRGVLGLMAAFKQHASYGFWKSRLMRDPHGLFRGGNTGMGGVRITDVADLPPDDVLIAYVQEAVALNEAGVKVERRRRPAKDLKIPAFFREALARNKKAAATFASLSPSCRREYAEWLAEAKREETRERRLATAIEWLVDGKSLDWKYKKKRQV
jgi:uncharacterized protein YdeI (YjbR/CyaY-like superfamily)